MKIILLVSLYFLIWIITAICLTINDYIDTNLDLDKYLEWRSDDIFVICIVSLLWPIFLPFILLYCSWMFIIRLVLSKVKRRNSNENR